MISAVIIVGGRGTRLHQVTCNLPKPLVRISDYPFLFYLIKQLSENGVRKIILLAGYLGQEIILFAEKYNVVFPNIEIIVKVSKASFDTGQRLLDALNILEDRFIFMYGDNFVPFDLASYIKKYQLCFNKSFILLYENNDFYSNSNICLGNNNLVLNYGKNNKKAKYVDIGYFILNKIDLINLNKKSVMNFGQDILKKLIEQKKLYGEVVKNRYYTVGTMERLQITRFFFLEKKFIFLDRDGVLNEKQERGNYVKNKDLFIWKKGALEALKILKKNNYHVILITNQAGIGKGVFNRFDLDEIHQKMCLDARNFGGEIEYIYVCPHHWEDDCSCRKPKPGMLIKAQKDLHIDLNKTFFIGDDERDYEASVSAGCKFYLIKPEERLDEVIKNLLDLSDQKL